MCRANGRAHLGHVDPVLPPLLLTWDNYGARAMLCEPCAIEMHAAPGGPIE